MTASADLLLFGTGQFAARILFDFAATARGNLSIAVAGRNARRLAWLRTAAAARADMFGTGVRVLSRMIPEVTSETAGALLAELQPSVVVNTASVQGRREVSEHPDDWTLLVRQAGFGITSVLHARLSLDIARAVAASGSRARFVNCCYPDVVNSMIRGAGLPITCGIGNIAILQHAFAGVLGPSHGRLRLLAQHEALAAFRRLPSERSGAHPPRVWLDEQELADVFDRFRAVQLALEPVIDISGAAGVPLFAAMISGNDWRGHVPGPHGLPGGYPVQLTNGDLRLDLPPGLSRDEAIHWNAAFEQENGVVVTPDGIVRYTGKLQDALHRVSPELAADFSMRDFAAVEQQFAALRTRLRQASPR